MVDGLTGKPDLTKPDQRLWLTLQAVQEQGGTAKGREITKKVLELGGYSDERRKEVVGRLGWTRTYLKAVGALEYSRGVWTITDYGRSPPQSDMASIQARAKAMRGQRPQPTTPEEPTAEEDAATPERYTGEGWRDRLLAVVQAMPPAAFERLCQRILRESGFTRVQVTGKSGDGGIDGVGVLRVNLVSFHIFFQAKRYKGSVGASAIRDFRGAMVGRTDKGLFITTGSFTADAERETTRDGAPVLDLIDGDELCTLLKERKLGVATEQIEAVTIDAAWFEHL